MIDIDQNTLKSANNSWIKITLYLRDIWGRITTLHFLRGIQVDRIS